MKSPQDMRIIQIDITNACQYQCSNCTRFIGHYKKPFFMDYETFKRAVDSLIGYHGTIGVMGGEPTLHPKFEEFIKYLNSRLESKDQKKETILTYPQKNFIDAIYTENLNNTEVYHYSTGYRDTITGAGLWSAMVPTYKKYYESIQDIFRMQAVNDHGNRMYHSPILISRRDLGISDSKWKKIRDNCWAQCVWSATITPKGAFFCEIAGALDMLFNGPGGWEIEPGWWKRQPSEFGEQTRWCEYCGIAIDTFTRDANDWIDDVSISMYKKLKEIESPKLKKPGRINIVQIKNGKILEESKKGTKEVRHENFYDEFSERFNKEKSILFASGFAFILDYDITSESDLLNLEKNLYYFDEIILISKPNKALDKIKNYSKVYIIDRDVRWGFNFFKALTKINKSFYILYSAQNIAFSEKFKKDYTDIFLNPGTLQISSGLEKCDYIENFQNCQLVALFNSQANSLKKIGIDRILNFKNFINIIECWEKKKIIPFNSSSVMDFSFGEIIPGKKYVIYGASGSGKKTLKMLLHLKCQIVFFSDSDEKKWGSKIEGYEVISPKELLKRRNEFDYIVVGSIYFAEIVRNLLKLGFKRKQIAELS